MPNKTIYKMYIQYYRINYIINFIFTLLIFKGTQKK